MVLLTEEFVETLASTAGWASRNTTFFSRTETFCRRRASTRSRTCTCSISVREGLPCGGRCLAFFVGWLGWFGWLVGWLAGLWVGWLVD